MRWISQAFRITCFLLLANNSLWSQEQKIADSLALIYQRTVGPDSTRLNLLRHLAFHEVRDYKKALGYADELIRLATATGQTDYRRMGYFIRGTKLRLLGRLDEALAAFFRSAELARQTKNRTAEGETYGAIADTYSVAGHHDHARDSYDKAIALLRQTNDSLSLATALYNAGDELQKIKRYDTALLYFTEAQRIFERKQYRSGLAYCLGSLGMVYAGLGKNALALQKIQQAIVLLEETEDYYPICDFLFSMADVYQRKNDPATALAYSQQSLRLAERYGLKEQIRDAHLKLSTLYEGLGKAPEALAGYKNYILYRDSINNLAAERKMADLRYNFGISQKQAEVDLLNEQKRNEKKLTVLLAVILGLAVLLLVVVFRTYKTKQRAYRILNKQKQETDVQRTKAEMALTELQLTQKQLIQSAKMASLGELTAGIAHEIQNPLNFVRNFSELSVELLHELREAARTEPSACEKDANQLLNDLDKNLQKINEHGKRADAIVKGMLQHTMGSTGKKERTDLNALVDEYLRLCYQGWRAKNKAIQVEVQTRLDDTIGRVDLVPQEIGRVLLNLYNNAFYAVLEKQQKTKGSFLPMVSVGTKRIGQQVCISVRDNGTGISLALLDKIYQPFFTTKPTGQGTGLGLSLSYDIIKSHGGELSVQTEDGQFTEFTITLPVSVKQETPASLPA